MGRYLDALKQLEEIKKAENRGDATLINLNNSLPASILGLLGVPPTIFPEKKAPRPTAAVVGFEYAATDLPALCDLLGLSWEQVEDAGILEPYDCGLIDGGAYSALRIIRYLLSWQAGGCCVPFGLLPDEVITRQLEKLQLAQPDGETVNQWLSVNGKKPNYFLCKSGGIT